MIRIRIVSVAVVAALLLSACVQLTPVRRVGDLPKQPPPDPLDKYTLEIAKARETGQWAIGEEWIAAVPPELLNDYRRWFEPQAHYFPPLWIYASARRLQEQGNYLKAAFWYIAARERQIRQLRRCTDDSAKEQLIWADGAFANLRTEMARHPELTRYSAKHAYAWLDLHEDTEAGLLEACLRGKAGVEQAKGGTLIPVQGGTEKTFRLLPPPVTDPGEWIIPAESIHDIRTWSRILMKKEVAAILGEPKDVPPTPTITPLR